MLKLLIADDEYLSIESIKLIIDKYVEDIEIVGTAKSGREAIEKAVQLKPDVIFMDIKMPGINGIEAIRQIKNINTNTKFVMITAYEYFDYAKEAINLGVHDYILKPLTKSKIIKTLSELNEVIQKEREIIKQEIIMKEKVTKVIPIMENQFIYSKIIDDEEIANTEFYEDIFGVKLNTGYVLMAYIDDNESVKVDKIKDNLKKQDFYETFTLSLKSITDCIVSLPLNDRIISYVIIDEFMDDNSLKDLSIEIANKVSKKIKMNVNINYRLGIGRTYGVENLLKSYNEAYIATSISSDKIVTHYEDILLSLNNLDIYPKSKDETLVQKALMGDLNGALNILDEIFYWLSLNYSDDINKTKAKLLELLIAIKRNINSHISEDGIFEQIYITNIIESNDINSLKVTFKNYIKSIVSNVENFKNSKLSGIISEAINYITKNYNKDISLDDVATELNMSYHYFSKFFKDTIGKNFVDYLTELRIEKSKELLKDNTISIKSICYEIGYHDPNYFSKIFRKATGMTPTEYRTSII